MEVLHNVFIKDVFNFTGRSSRDELLLFTVLFSILSMISSYFLPFIPKIMGQNSIVMVNVLIVAILCIPFFSLLVRRLHDSGNSGLWIFFLIVPVVNIYVFYLIFVKPSVKRGQLMKVLQNMKVKDIINRKVIKDDVNFC